MREQLRAQLNQVLETKEEAGRLIVNMSDVLFDFGQYTLKPGAKEKLAKISGILISHPGLTLEVDGHTDSVGSDAMNLTLSERRADTVREYLVAQGVAPDTISAHGFGKDKPVATNETAAGRQLEPKSGDCGGGIGDCVEWGAVARTKLENRNSERQTERGRRFASRAFFIAAVETEG